MKATHWIIAAAALTFVQPTPASAAQSDPEIIIYRFPGVRDDGGAFNAGVATVFHCTNFSGVTENIRFVTRQSTGALVHNTLVTADHLQTWTTATHGTLAYFENTQLITGLVNQGTMAIAATSINIICTAETIDASSATPIGIARRGIRFSPVPGSQE
jgi:hypothetical protein